MTRRHILGVLLGLAALLGIALLLSFVVLPRFLGPMRPREALGDLEVDRRSAEARREGRAFPGEDAARVRQALGRNGRKLDGRAAALLLAEHYITILELDEAERLLESRTGPEVSRLRARLSIYRADCEGASARLSSAQAVSAKGARELREFAERCANGTVGGEVVEDRELGVWVRLQDRQDRALVPMILRTAAQARAAIERDLGTTLPRPLRLDLVRDLFTLSAVSGLPLDAAETTGTVAVARFGRVTMLSPRATRQGYPWQDTLAHEITHLVLSRASAEKAPLWLQEGVAKREETRWRSARAFDEPGAHDQQALAAQQSGRSVGLDKLGPSLAMLPSADAASIAFAEVTSFVGFLIAECGERVLPALLAELNSLSSPERALQGVTGLGLAQWQVLWRAALEKKELIARSQDQEQSPILTRRAARLAELLFLGGKYEASAERAEVELDRAPHSPVLRFQAARALGQFDREHGREVLGELADVSGPFAGHLALLSDEPGSPPGLFEQAFGLDPFLIEVACARPRPEGRSDASDFEALCRHVTSLPRRGSE